MSEHSNTVENEAAFPSWDAKHRDASRIVDEANGWARNINPGDDALVLAWAREYLPRILAHGARPVA